MFVSRIKKQSHSEGSSFKLKQELPGLDGGGEFKGLCSTTVCERGRAFLSPPPPSRENKQTNKQLMLNYFIYHAAELTIIHTE